jgi:hypothetical protein
MVKVPPVEVSSFAPQSRNRILADRILPQVFFLKHSSSSILPQAFFLKHSSSSILPQAFFLKHSVPCLI